jgi:6-phosphogluconolactonase
LWVAAILDSPKPPPERITLTLPVLNHARMVAFVVCGAAKADVVRNILEEGNSDNFPAGLVRPQLAGGKLVWMLDGNACAKLQLKDAPRSEL